MMLMLIVVVVVMLLEFFVCRTGVFKRGGLVVAVAVMVVGMAVRRGAGHEQH